MVTRSGPAAWAFLGGCAAGFLYQPKGTEMSDMILITGNTFPVKDALREMGGRWDAAAKGWRVPAPKADQARALVGAMPAGNPYASRKRNWQPCGYPGCNPRYCDECDGEGYRNGR